MKKYIETYYGHRYTCGEMAIALKTRDITDEHLDYVAKLAANRYSMYASIVKNVNWMVTPTKVTAHEFSLRNYLNNNSAYSWAWEVKHRIEKMNEAASPFFNPYLLSDLSLMFKYDTHWSPLGALRYLDSFFDDIGILDLVRDKISTKDNGDILYGNCQSPNERLGERFISVHSIPYINIFKTPDFSTPDLNIEINMSCDYILDEKVLIIHSSSYQFCKAFVSGLFRETVEIFSPYIPADIISVGCFDRIIIQSAERNIDVAYDGSSLNKKILASINNDKTKLICNHIRNELPKVNIDDCTKHFLFGLAEHWNSYES